MADVKDFTLEAYAGYLKAIRSFHTRTVLFRDILGKPLPERFCAIRHDVDRKPERALRLARVEKELGLVATYYFRVPYTTDGKVIRAIAAMGHEVGYHYENLSETNGDKALAMIDFKKKLELLRGFAEIRTISMHGRPLKPFDNRDLWRHPDRRQQLDELGLVGEVYLDMDYSDVAYINDTGRNWSSSRSNRRDQVDSLIKADFASGTELMSYLKERPHGRMVFQVHPERWTEGFAETTVQAGLDTGVNLAKRIIRTVRP